MQKNKIINLLLICSAVFVLLIISKILGLSWLEISGVFLAVIGTAIAVWQGIKSIGDEEQASIASAEERLIKLVNGVRLELIEKDKDHDRDINAIRQQAALIPTVIQEQFQIKSEINGVMRDLEQLSAALAQSSKYAEVLKRQSGIEKRVSDLEDRG